LIRKWCAASLLVFCVTQNMSAQKIQIGEDVQVSAGRSNLAHFETQLSADPGNPDLLLGCSMAFTPGTDRAETVVYLSRDGGKSWSVSLEDDPGKFSGDPSCAYGPDGMAYFTAAGYGPDLKPSMSFYRSKNSGRTWMTPLKIQVTDREYITVNARGGKSPGQVYVHGIEFENALDATTTWSAVSSLNVVRSLDGGVTFERPLRAASIGDHLIFAMGNGAVLSDGTLVVLYVEVKDRNNFRLRGPKLTEPNAWLKIARVQDGGERLSKSTVVSDFYLAEETPRWRHHMPALAVDQTSGPFRDRLYAVWPDIRSGRSQIMLSHSEDKGRSWSPPIVVSDDQARPGANSGPDDFMPAVAVNNKGVVGISWYDRHDSPDNLGWWTRFAASVDGGETFLPSVKVSKAPFALDHDQDLLVYPVLSGGGLPPDWGGGGPVETLLWIGRFDYTGGDTAGLAADALGTFHPFWVDNRTGTPQVWTNTVAVSSAAFPNGSPELAALEDVSEHVTLEYSNVHYDRKTELGSMDVRLHNASSSLALSALKMRVLVLASEAGEPEILNADNQIKTRGALFDFVSLLNGKSLAPGALTQPKHVTFRLTGFKSLRPTGSSVPVDSLLTMDARVLGKIEK
jgi:hypothetical protein